MLRRRAIPPAFLFACIAGSAAAAPLFKPAPAPSAGTPLAKISAGEYARQEAFVAVDWKGMFAADAGGASGPEGVARRLDLNLLPNARWSAERTRLSWQAPGRFTWVGRIGDDPVVISVNDGAMHGSVQSEGRVFEIETLPGGTQRVIEQDPALYDEAGGCETAEEAPAAAPLPAPAGAPDPVIDVMILYDAAVASRTADMQVYLASLIEMSNESYRISKIPQAIRLVHSRQVNSGVTGSHNSWLGRDTLVASLRDRYGADLVAMLIESGISYCGVASGAYTTTKRSCAVGNKTFTHELGHNMGAGHAWEQFTSHNGFAYGYINHVKSWRTVMSYAECSNGGRCTRILNFSNPDALYNGDPTGIADSRDNARKMRSRSLALSNNRPTKVGGPVGLQIVDAPGAGPGYVLRGVASGSASLLLDREEYLEAELVSLDGRRRPVLAGTFAAGEVRLAWDQAALGAGVHALRVSGARGTAQVRVGVLR